MRPHRLKTPEKFYHVTARGHNRQPIFQTDVDKLDYLKRLSEIFPSHQIRTLSYCLMTNHLHLLVQDVKGTGLPKAMQRLQGAYALQWNVRYNRTGGIYNERHNPKPVEGDNHLVFSSVYIHVNPVEAGIVRNPREYRWSSFRAYLGEASDIPVSSELIFDLCGGRKGYERLISEKTASVLKGMDVLPEEYSARGLEITGSKLFVEGLRPSIERRAERRNHLKRPVGMDIASIWKYVEKETSITRKDIAGPTRVRNVSQARALFCALTRREGISPTLVAQEINRSRSAVVHLAKNYEMKVLNREK